METLSYSQDTKANKEHPCSFCGEKINKGEIYNLSVHKHDGEIYNWRTHKYCGDLATVLKMYDDADEGVSEDTFREHISECHDQLLISFLPIENTKAYSDLIQQIRHVNWNYKLKYVLRHFIKLGKIKLNSDKNDKPSVATEDASSKTDG